MIRPEQPEPNHRFKTMQTVIAPSGFTFEYCLDSDTYECDVTDELQTASQQLHSMFELMNDIFSPKK